MTVERLERFKNHSIVQKEYQEFLIQVEWKVFNRRQKNLYKEWDPTSKQITFRYFYDKKAREGRPDAAKQYRMLAIELMRIVYGHAPFFRELEQNRPNFLDELLSEIEKASDKAPDKLIKQIKDIARLELEDHELQEVFYRMLKGTISRDEITAMKDPSDRQKEKSYPSLFTYINYDGRKDTPTIRIALVPRETLKAIFLEDEAVEAIIKKRRELGGKNRESGSDALFRSEFIDKRRPGIDDQLLDFTLSPNSKKYD
jgi:hypothetical protein